MRELERITGSKESLSPTVRLDRFLGTREEILSVSRDKNPAGISSLLCADSDTRQSYYLGAAEIEALNRDEKILLDGIGFYKTDYRFDDWHAYKSFFAQNYAEDDVIVFTHEWILNPRPRKKFIAWFFDLVRGFFVKRNINQCLAYFSQNGAIFVNEF